MKKSTQNWISSIMAIILFVFGLAAFWVGKIDWGALIPLSLLSIGLVAFRSRIIDKYFPAK